MRKSKKDFPEIVDKHEKVQNAVDKIAIHAAALFFARKPAHRKPRSLPKLLPDFLYIPEQEIRFDISVFNIFQSSFAGKHTNGIHARIFASSDVSIQPISHNDGFPG